MSMVHAFTYAPGDGHRYTWDGTGPIVVERIITDPVTGRVLAAPTGETIRTVPEMARTASALAERVSQWLGIQ